MTSQDPISKEQALKGLENYRLHIQRRKNTSTRMRVHNRALKRLKKLYPLKFETLLQEEIQKELEENQ